MTILSYTSNFRFSLIDYNTRTWHEDEYLNWRNLDGILAAAETPPPFAVATGAVNAFIVDYDPVIQAYTPGLILSFRANNAVTGATTVKVGTLNSRQILRNGSPLVAGDIPNGSYVRIRYDGTQFALLDPAKSILSDGRIVTGSSGATAATTADDLVVESNIDVGQSFLSPNGTVVRIYFGRTANNTAGGIIYNHATDIMTFRAGIADVATLSGLGVLTASSFVGSLTGNSAGTHTGPVIGNASTASALATARQISLSGDLSGNVNFDGSANVSINAQIAGGAVTNTELAGGAAVANIGFTPANAAGQNFTGAVLRNGETLVRVDTGTAANSGKISWGTAAPGTLDEGEIYLRYV